MTVIALNHMLFWLLIVAFLVFEPRGLVEVWERSARRRSRTPGWARSPRGR